MQIQCRGRLVPGIIALLMDGECEDGWIVSKNLCGSVAVMDVGVDDNRLANRSVGLHSANRDGHIVNGAKPFAVARIRVMESAAQIAAEAIAHSALRGKNRTACCQ